MLQDTITELLDVWALHKSGEQKGSNKTRAEFTAFFEDHPVNDAQMTYLVERASQAHKRFYERLVDQSHEQSKPEMIAKFFEHGLRDAIAAKKLGALDFTLSNPDVLGDDLKSGKLYDDLSVARGLLSLTAHNARAIFDQATGQLPQSQFPFFSGLLTHIESKTLPALTKTMRTLNIPFNAVALPQNGEEYFHRINRQKFRDLGHRP